MPDGALFSVANAAVYGMVQALQAELRSRPPRITEVRCGGVVGWRMRGAHPHPLALHATRPGPLRQAC